MREDPRYDGGVRLCDVKGCPKMYRYGWVYGAGSVAFVSCYDANHHPDVVTDPKWFRAFHNTAKGHE